MRDEVKRILKLVEEGKLSAEDAAELIEAFEGGTMADEPRGEHASETPPPPPPPGTPPSPPKDPLKHLVEAMEKLTRDAFKNVNWHELATQARESGQKAAETIKSNFENVSKGKGFTFGFGFGNVESRTVTLPLIVPAGKVLRIENPCGDIRILGHAAEGEVTAHAQFRGASEDARAKADLYTLVIEESDGAVVIKQPDVTGLAVDLDIRVPGSVTVEVKSESGDIEISETKAGCRVSSKSGDVVLRGLDGPVEIVATSGDFIIEDSAAPSVTIENKSGDITLRRVSGNANIRTASGDVSLRDCDLKSLAVDGVSGNVDVDLRSPITGAVTIRTVNGNVLVGIPDGSDCRVGLKTLRGNVSCAIPLQDEARQDSQVTGKLGNGKGTLDVSAVNGNITVEMHVSF